MSEKSNVHLINTSSTSPSSTNETTSTATNTASGGFLNISSQLSPTPTVSQATSNTSNGSNNTLTTTAGTISISNNLKSSTSKLSSVYTPDQLELLKSQILAFKLISSNVAIPQSLQQKFLLNSILQNDENKDTDTSVSNEQSKNIKFLDGQEKSDDDIGPGSSVALKLLYSILHGQSAQAAQDETASTTLLFPSIIPEFIDANAIVQERERMIQARMNERMRQLENLPTENVTEIIRLKSLIELKCLKLASFQKKLRMEVLSHMNKLTTLTSSGDLAAYRRHRKNLLRTTKITERQPVKPTTRVDKGIKERRRHLEFMNSIIERAKEFQSFHRAYQQQKINKLAKAILHIHSQAEKEEIKRLDRLSRERISALKADDEEAYLKLIDQQKDTRLTHLLRQTDLYLESLTSLVLSQKNDPLHTGAQGSEMDDQFEFDEPSPGSKADYYLTAHKIYESVDQQPSILIGGKLKDYQMKGLQWMVSLYNNRLNGILADEMGLGKTIQTIALVSYLLEKKNQNGPYLVIVPLSTMTNWSVEFEKWAPAVAKVEYKGTPYQRKALQSEIKHSKFNVMLTTYEYIIKDKSFLSRIKWLYIIIDEGHRMKNTESKLSTVLTTNYSTRFRVILTGTPLQNNLPELWALLNFILPKIFNSSRTFDEWFNAPFANTGEKFELNEEETLLIIRRLHKVLRPFLLRRLKKDVEAELPDKIERIIKCQMSSLQSKLYSIIKEKSMMTIGKGASAGSNVGIRRFNNTIMQLRKICNHPFVFEEVEQQVNPQNYNNDYLYRVSGKFELLKRILPKFHATGHRVLIFFQMTMVMTVMEDFLNMEGYKYLRLDGSTKAEERSELLKKFNAPNSPYFIFLLSTRAGGLGLNLQTADTVIIFDSDWNPHQDLQAQDRAHRIGQTKEVRIFRLVTIDSVEEVILAKAQYKLNLDGKIIQAGKFDHKSTNEEREAMLRAILETEQGNVHEGENEIFDDDELNEIISRSEDELSLFKSIDEEMAKIEMQKVKEASKCGKKWSRLIDASELPPVYMNDHLNLAEDDDSAIDYGRGQRPKKNIVYNDRMTDDQWLRKIEEEAKDAEKEETNSWTPPSSVGRPGRKRLSMMLDQGISETDSASSSPLGSRMMSSLEGKEPLSGLPKRFKHVSRATGSLGSGHLDTSLQRTLLDIFEKLDDTREEGTGRMRTAFFKSLPSKSLYPDYYRAIKKPIALKQIRRKIDNMEYMNLDQFKSDVILMFDNAMTYNMEGSVIYKDACSLKESFLLLLEEQNSPLSKHGSDIELESDNKYEEEEYEYSDDINNRPNTERNSEDDADLSDNEKNSTKMTKRKASEYSDQENLDESNDENESLSEAGVEDDGYESWNAVDDEDDEMNTKQPDNVSRMPKLTLRFNSRR